MAVNKYPVVTAIIVFLGPALLVGCGRSGPPRFVVRVDALATPEAAEARRYVLRPGMEAVSERDLQFREYAEYLNRALQAEGFEQVASIKDADVVVFVAYEIGGPEEHTYSYSVPHFGQTGVSSSRTYGSVQSFGSGYGTYSATTTYQPEYGITGYSSHIGTYTTFTRWLQVSAYRLSVKTEAEEPEEVWRLSAISTGSSGDLRRVFPILVTAAQPYLGKSTQKKAVDVALYESDEAVVAIREGVSPSEE